MILRIVIILIAGVVCFILGTWLGSTIWPGSTLSGAVIGALIFGGGVLYMTRDLGRPEE